MISKIKKIFLGTLTFMLLFASCIVGFNYSSATPTPTNSFVIKEKNNSKSEYGFKSTISNVRGSQYTYSGDSWKWTINFSSDKGDDYDWKFFAKATAGKGNLTCKVDNKAIAKGSDCSGFTDILRKKSQTITFDLTTVNTDKSLPIDRQADTELEFYAVKYKPATKKTKTKLITTYPVLSNTVYTYANPIISNTPSSQSFINGQATYLGSYVDYYVTYKGYIPLNYTFPSYSSDCSSIKGLNGTAIIESGTKSNNYLFSLHCKGTVASDNKEGSKSISFKFNGTTTTKQLNVIPNNWSYSVDVTGSTIEDGKKTLCSAGVPDSAGCSVLSENNVLNIGSLTQSGRYSTVNLNNFKLYKNGSTTLQAIFSVDLYDNASTTNNLDDSVFSSLISDAMSNSATDSIVKSGEKDNTNFALTIGSFAGKRNIEIRIMPNSERGLYGILNSNFAVFGEPEMMGISSANDNVDFNCEDKTTSQSNKYTTCSIDNNVPIGDYIKEYVKVNQYTDGNDENPSWVGGQSIPNIDITQTTETSGLSAFGIYTTYEISGQIKNAETYTGTIYFGKSLSQTVINLKLSGYNDVPTTNLADQIAPIMVYGENIGIKNLNVNNINTKIQNVVVSNDIGLNTSTHNVDASKYINSTIATGAIKSPGTITVKTEKPDVKKSNDISYYTETYNVGTIDLANLSNVRDKNSLTLSAPEYEGVNHIWKYKGKTVSRSRTFSPKLSMRNKKATLTVIYGTREKTQPFVIGKFKPTIKTNSKIAGNKIISKITIKGYKLSGKLIKIGKKKYKLKKGVVKVKLPIKTKTKIVFTGNSKTAKTSKTIRVF